MTVEHVVLLVCVGIYTLVTMITDLRMRRIPNAVTVPMFAAGLLYQAAFRGWPGLSDGLIAFAFAFGTLFLLWMVGGAGGGDAKLMGGLSVWLGWRMTLYVVIASIFYVVLGSILIILLNIARKGARRTLQQYQADRSVVEGGKKRKPVAETIEQRQKRRIMPYACPVALATWTVLLVQFMLRTQS
ncbi:MAG: prepilin peptidase [Planctomycetota bacterium]|nr:MAG: prepilin peptidase [Planctomycetota bacterium]